MSDRPNILAPAIRENPYPFYAELRKGPVRQVDPMGMWVISRHEDVVAVLKDAQRFSNKAYAAEARPPWLDRMPFEQSMLTLDPPAHTKMRALVAKAFGPSVVTRLEPHVKTFADKLAEQMVRQKDVDFVEQFAMPLPAFAIGDMLGLDPSLHHHFKKWSDDMMTLTSHPTEEQIPSIIQSVKATDHYFSQVIEDRRRAPREDLVSDLLRAEIDGQALSTDDVLSFCFLLLLAGLETAKYLMASSMNLLTEHPDVLARVMKDRSLIPRVVDETLRYEPPLHVCHRLTTTNVDMGGVTIPARSMVLVLMGAAMHDEKAFPEPERFNIDREKPTQLPFGHGAHFCIGSFLAKMEARVGLEAVFSRIKGVTKPQQQISWSKSLSTRGPDTLRLIFDPA